MGNPAAGHTGVAVVGAGVAGLAAAKLARAHGASVTVLEARGRIGGRALTDSDRLGWTWDRGAHWLHCADINPFTTIADRLGFTYKASRTPHRLWLGDRWADEHDHAALEAAVHARNAAIASAGQAGRDVPASEVLPPADAWTPLIHQRLAALTGADPDVCSTLDDARYHDTGEHWPVSAGFGALISRWAADVPVHLNAPVSAIDWQRADRVRLRTPNGELTAEHAIVTVPTSVLARGAIRFDPVLPGRYQDAIAALPLGGATKIALAFDRDVFGSGMCHMTSKPHAPEGMTFQLSPFDRPLAIGYLGGRYADSMEAEGPAAMAERALDILADAFGTGIRRRVTGWSATAWSRDPYSRGGYSIAMPGRAHLRHELARPIAPRLRLAGEACEIHSYGTVNAAYASGRRAAAAALGLPASHVEQAD
jgi:monoamine oxidase